MMDQQLVILQPAPQDIMTTVGMVTAETKTSALPKQAALYTFPKNLLGKAPARIRSRGELSTARNRVRGSRNGLTVSSAPTRATKVSSSYLNDLQLLNKSQALEDPTWTPEGQPKEILDAYNRAISVGTQDKKKKGSCNNCGNPNASDKWCPCQWGDVVIPKDQKPGDYAFYLVRGEEWDASNHPPVLRCKSSGKNESLEVQQHKSLEVQQHESLEVQQQCKKFLDSLPPWATPAPAAVQQQEEEASNAPQR